MGAAEVHYDAEVEFYALRDTQQRQQQLWHPLREHPPETTYAEMEAQPDPVDEQDINSQTSLVKTLAIAF